MIAAIGQIWVARPAALPWGETGYLGQFAWKRFVRVDEIDRANDRIVITTVRKEGGKWLRSGKTTKARLSRFDGGYWNYAFVE
jgi:hypothetical protein